MRMPVRRLMGCAVVVLTVVLSNCGGGGGGGSSPGGGPPPTGGQPIAAVAVSVLGSAVAGVPGTFPVTVAVYDKNGKLITGTYPVSITLSDSDPSGATTLSTTTVTSSNTSVVLAYNGKPMSSAATVTASANGLPPSAVTAALFLPGSQNAMIASIALSIVGFPIAGVAGSFPVTVTVKDQRGKVITGSYPLAITLSDSDTSGATTLSTTTVASSTAPVMLNYSGKLLPSGVTIGASASGVAPSAITPAQFTPNGQNPLGNGASFTYAQSETVTDLPAGTPQTSTFTNTETVATGASFNGQNNLIDLHEVDTPVNPAPSPGFTSNQDEYLTWASNGNSAQLLEVGYSFAHGDNNSTTTGTNTWSPGYILDELPQTTGNSWSPLAANVYSDKTVYPSNEVTTTNIQTNVDGSYTKHLVDTIPDGGGSSAETIFTSDTTVPSNGTFTYKLGSVYTNPTTPSDVLDTFTSTTPTTSGGSIVIPVQDNCQTGGAPFPGTPPAGGFPAACSDSNGNSQQNATTMINVQDWFPFPGGSAQSPLDVAKVTVNGTGAIPSQCKVSSSIATSAVNEHYKETDLDPTGVLAYYTEDFYYSPNVGLVCETYNNFVEFFDYLSTGTLLQETQTSGTYSLTATQQPQVARKQATNVRQSSVAPVMAMMIRRDHEAVHRQILRMQRDQARKHGRHRRIKK